MRLYVLLTGSLRTKMGTQMIEERVYYAVWITRPPQSHFPHLYILICSFLATEAHRHFASSRS